MLPNLVLLLLLVLASRVDCLFDNLFSSDKNTATKIGTLDDMRNASCEQLSSITKELLSFKLFYGSAPHQSVEFPVHDADKIVNNMRWKHGDPVVLFIHDYMQSIHTQPTFSVIDAYFDGNRPLNVLFLEWSGVAFLPYPSAVAALPAVARRVAAGLDLLVGAGGRLAHVAGHGLGAHLAGAVARAMTRRVRYIMALDPSGPLFYEPQCQQPLSASDADCVQVVHTHLGGVGAPRATGTVDFFPNGGLPRQPGCGWWHFFDKLCSHNRAIELWKEVLRVNNTFIGRKCQSWEAFQVKKCLGAEERLQIGASCGGKSGKFYMWTHGKYPYGMGPEGAAMGPKP